MLFSFNLLTIAISSQLQCGLTICTFHSYFLRLVVSHALFSTDAWFFLFPAILVAQVLVGAMGKYSSNMGMVLGTFLLLSFRPGFCTFACGPRDFAPLRKDYTPASLRFLCSCLRYALQDPLFP